MSTVDRKPIGVAPRDSEKFVGGCTYTTENGLVVCSIYKRTDPGALFRAYRHENGATQESHHVINLSTCEFGSEWFCECGGFKRTGSLACYKVSGEPEPCRHIEAVIAVVLGKSPGEAMT